MLEDDKLKAKKRNTRKQNRRSDDGEWWSQRKKSQKSKTFFFKKGEKVLYKKEIVTILKRHKDLSIDQTPENEVYTIFIPSLNRERQTIGNRIQKNM